jgi:glutathione peroxidase
MSIYDFTVKDSHGNDMPLSDFEGKVLLIVNTATKCGLTPQYTALQELYDKYKDKGFEVLDFPCNQFMKQAPGTDNEINEFCTLKYSTAFPRFAKIDVNGQNADPLYVWLKEQILVDTGDDKSASFEKKVKILTRKNKPEDIK